MLRKNPVLREALSHHHPLFECRINGGWRQDGIATIHLIRRAPSGLVLGAFLIDLFEQGLKDAWGDHQVPLCELEELWEEQEMRGVLMTPCDYSLARRLIHGGVDWARRNGFRLQKGEKVWMRLVEPPESDEPDLALFGNEAASEIPMSYDEPINWPILQNPLPLEGDDLPNETLDRIGNIKGALINFSSRPEFRQESEALIAEEFGDNELQDDPEKRADLIDRFVLEHALKSGGGSTVSGTIRGIYRYLRPPGSTSRPSGYSGDTVRLP